MATTVMKGIRKPGPDGRAHGRTVGGVLQKFFPMAMYPPREGRKKYMKEMFPTQKSINRFAAFVSAQASTEDDSDLAHVSIKRHNLERLYDIGIEFLPHRTQPGAYSMSLTYLDGRTRIVSSINWMTGHAWSRYWHDAAKHFCLAYEHPVAALQAALEIAPAAGWSRTDMLRVLRGTVGSSKEYFELYDDENIPHLAEYCAPLLVDINTPYVGGKEVQEVEEDQPAVVEVPAETPAGAEMLVEDLLEDIVVPPPPAVASTIPLVEDEVTPAAPGRREVAVRLEYVTLRNSRGGNTPSVKVRCSRCGKTAECLGQSERSVNRACVLLRTDCAESNFYAVDQT